MTAGMNDLKDGQDEVKVVVSDAMAKNSRQLLNAHVYNYLIVNERFDTARQFLLEADVPVFEERNRSNEERVRRKQELNGDLLPAKMLMDCKETFLYEWWESFDSLQKFVDNTPSEAFKSRNSLSEPIVPLAPPNNMSTYNMMGMRTPQGPPPSSMARNTGSMPHQVPSVSNNASPSFIPNGPYANFEVNEDGTPNFYSQDNAVFSRQR